MERVRRRFWTWTVSAVAIVVIAGAVVSGLFQLAVLALPSYREDLSAWVTQVADRPVQIGGVNLVWRGLTPRLDLSDITLFDEGDNPALSAQRLSLGFSLPRMLMGEVTPSRVELSGISVAVEIDEAGNVSVAGFDAQQQLPRSQGKRWVKQLRRFRSVRLENCEVRLTHAGGQPQRYVLQQADIDRTDAGFDLEGRLQLPDGHGDAVIFDAEIAGDVAEPPTWSGEFSAETSDLQPHPWLERYLAEGSAVAANNLDVRIDGRLRAGRIESLDLHGESDELALARAGRVQLANSLVLQARLTPDGADGWRLEWPELQLDDQPQLNLGLRWRKLEDGGFQLDADADDIHLQRLSPWLGYVRDPPEWLAAVARTGGDVRGLVLRLRKGSEGLTWSVRASLQSVALEADARAGFAGLSGDLSATEAGGRFELSGRALRVELPEQFENPIPFDQLTGTVEWRRAAEGWHVSLPAFTVALAGGQGRGNVSLLLPTDAERSPVLDLRAHFAAPDATRFKPFMPRFWGEGLHRWLGAAIQRGRVPSLDLVIRGPLRDFPFVEKPTGDWRLDIDAADVRLAFQPDWPVADQVDAHLEFRGHGLAIEAQSGRIAGSPVRQAQARFDDFRQALLVIDGIVEGEMGNFYQFVRRSPLRKTLAGLVDNTVAAGQATVGVHLEIPLHDAHNTRVAGSVGLQGVQLRYAGLDEPISGIRGELFFTERGARAERVAANFADLALDVRVTPREGTVGVVAADFDFTPQADGSGASRYVPALIRRSMSGTSRWLAELPLADRNTALVLSSDLVGTRSGLPAPLRKDAAEAVPVRVSIGSDANAPVRVRVNYRERLDADIALAKTGDDLALRGASIQLGSGIAPAAPAEGIVLGGEVAELDLPAWSGAVKGAGIEGVGVRRAELQAGRLMAGGQAFRSTHLVYVPTPQGGRVKLTGEGLEGDVDWFEGEESRLVARLAHASVDMADVGDQIDAVAGGNGEEAERPANDPAKLPVLDLMVDRLVVRDTEFGRLRLVTARVPGGQKIETLGLSGGKVDLTGTGQWRRSEERSSAELEFNLGSTDVASALKALGYAPNLDARQTRFTADLQWPASAAGLRWEQAQGRVDVAVENGILRSVEPGAGRVLGLINFYALPRRLTLDFRDVVNTGLAFDRVEGGFDLGGGVATTDDLSIEGPSLRMEVRGRIGLAARDYDQRVTVYPDISAGVTLGAALLAGPAVGALVLLAQEVLDKPLDQVTQLSYRLTGTWDNPKVEKAGAGG